MAIHDLPKKWRDTAHGDAGLLACADKLEARLNDAALCYISTGHEICFEMIVPDAVFHAAVSKISLALHCSAKVHRSAA